MANISSAHGTLTLNGDWNQEAIDLFQKILNCWSFHGEYGLEADGLLSLDQRLDRASGAGQRPPAGLGDLSGLPGTHVPEAAVGLPLL